VSSDPHAQLVAIFREEASEILGELRALFAGLREASDERARAGAASAMRLAHNLKGSAGSAGFDAVAQAAHALEDTLLGLREAGAGALGEGAPRLRDAIAAIERALENPAVGAAHAEPTPAEQQPDPVPALAQAAAPQPSPSARATVRIDATRLARLFGFVSELLVTRTAMQRRQQALELQVQSFAALRRQLEGATRMQLDAAVRGLTTQVDEHRRATAEFTRLATDLQQAMRQVGMIPLTSLAALIRRTVEDAARAADKPVELELDLKGIELDKVIIDGLRVPLVHLLRNAVDHGIESRSTRATLGKPEEGLIRVRAEVSGSMVLLTVADDGAGIDLKRVRAAVAAKRLATADEVSTLGDAELIDFLFAAGFSTRGEVTLLSGRGVGLDVARRALLEIGGNVRAQARGELGGAAFHLAVPPSLLSSRGLMVRAGPIFCAFPLGSIERVTRVRSSAIHMLEGSPVVSVDGFGPLRLQWLSHLFGDRADQGRGLLDLLVVSDGSARVAVAVDEILHEEDFVVRKLPWNLHAVSGVAGAVVLPDGGVAVVVDVPQLFRQKGAAPLLRASPSQPARRRVLVVDDSMTTRTLHRNALAAVGCEVIVASDGQEAWDLLQREAVEVVVTDVQMPNLDGFELTRRIRAHDRLRDLPVVLVTSLARPEDVQRGLEAGADEHVVKGALEQDALIAAVARHTR
jgi:two-component system chemotaxis sensor kinase CheA